MPVTLDLTQRHFTHRRGPLTVYGTWVKLPSGWQPCLALVRTGEEAGDETWPCIVTLDKAWVFEERTGDGAQAARILHSFIGHLRLTDAPATVFFLAGLVHDLLGDLLTIPPYQAPDRPALELAELTITDHRTGKTHEQVLTDV